VFVDLKKFNNQQLWTSNYQITGAIRGNGSCFFLVLLSMKHNFLVRAHYFPGLNDKIGDTLSLFGFNDSRNLHPVPTRHPVPSRLPSLPSLCRGTQTALTPQGRGISFRCFVHVGGGIVPASDGTFVYFASYLARKVRQTYLAAVHSGHTCTISHSPHLA